jgi:DNA-binding NtrC family response regulator
LYRLAQYTIFIAPLRERREDIPLLVNHYMNYYLTKYERNMQPVPHEIMDMLQAYDWPGNVRELQSVLNRVVISGKFDVLREHTNMAGISVKPEKSKKIHDTEANLILSILTETKWNRRRAAELLGISYSTLRRKIEKYEMDIGMKQFSDVDGQMSKQTDIRPGT